MSAMLADYGVQYGVQKRSLARQRDATLATNAYSRFLAQQRGNRSLGDLDRNLQRGLSDLDRNYTRGYERVGASLGQRGLRNSGIANNTFGLYTGDYQLQRTRMNEDYGLNRQRTNEDMWNALTQIQMSDTNAWDNYNQSAADIDLMKQANILSTAAQLDAFKPFLGS